MEIPWGGFWQKSRNRLKAGWLITAGLVAIYLGAVEPMNRMKGISSSRATGLAASADWQPSITESPSASMCPGGNLCFVFGCPVCVPGCLPPPGW